MKNYWRFGRFYWQLFPRMPQIRNVPEPFIFWTAVRWNVPALRFPDGSMPKCLSGCFPMERIKPGRWRPWKSLILNFGRKRIPKPKTNFIASRSSRKREKKIPAARWLVPESSGRHVAFFTRYQTYKMSNKGLVGIVNPKLNVTEPSAYFGNRTKRAPYSSASIFSFRIRTRK